MTKNMTAPQSEEAARTGTDLVDRIFEYLLKEFPNIEGLKLEETKRAVREDLGGQEWYVRRRDSESVAARVLALFNGRNATEVARVLEISRSHVYRCLKQAGGVKSVADSPVNETAGPVGSARNAPTAQKRN